MEIYLTFRAEAVGFEERGAVSLPKHHSKFVKRETQLLELATKLELGEIEDDEYLSNVADLFISPKWFNIIKDACSRIDGGGQDLEEEEIQEMAEAIFLDETTRSRTRRRSSKFFGEEWVNQF